MNRVFSFVIAILLVTPSVSKAQTEFSVGADVVSSYVWRGNYLGGASIQPSLGLKAGGFNVGFWGSTEIANLTSLKEVDFSLGYTIGGFSVGLTDYWTAGEGLLASVMGDEAGGYNYFQFKETHWLEVNLGYSFDFGLNLSLNTFVGGAGDKYWDDKGKEKRAFTTYFEAGYDFKVGDVSLTAALGCSPWNKSGYYLAGYPYATEDFAVTNISLAASKDIVITDTFSLPVFGQLVFNPAKEDVFLVFGISF